MQRGASLAASFASWAVLLCLLGCWSAAVAQPRTTEGRVNQVIDGDSLWLRPVIGAPIEVRLLGIDAPEGCQPGGHEARRALEAMVMQRPVVLRSTGQDAHGRLLGTLEAGGINVNQRLVEQGHAWSYRFKDDPGPYAVQERSARAAGRGLHASEGAERPRDFRRRHGPCQAGDQPAR